jgi:predicted alpha/beta-hydrolase family hydrolase
MSEIEAIKDTAADPPVRGVLHRPVTAQRASLVLTHGAGSNCNAPLLVSLADSFAGRGIATLRCDLPYRQRQPFGPPRATAAEDQAGLRRVVELIRTLTPGPVFLGGQSYGGRQASMLVASEPQLVKGLLLLSYPLHPPRKPQQLRVSHFPKIETPALFVSGAKDLFGSPEELRAAIARIPAKVSSLSVEGVGHDLGFGRSSRAKSGLPESILRAFEELFLAG